MNPNGHTSGIATAPDLDYSAADVMLELGTRDGLALCLGVGLMFVFAWLMLIGYMRRR